MEEDCMFVGLGHVVAMRKSFMFLNVASIHMYSLLL